MDYLKNLAPKQVCLTSDPFMIDLGVLNPVESYFKAHGIEAFTSQNHTQFSDAYALKAIDLIFGRLVSSYEQGNLRQPKADMQIAATLAGMAFNQSGLGICHSIARSRGARFHISR